MRHASPWSDPDRRRALLLTLLVHALVLLALVAWIDFERPEREPPERFLVIDVGTPAPALTETPAPADDAPAPTAPAPRVASDVAGAPTPGTPGRETGGEAAVEPDPVAEAPAEPSPATPEAAPEEPTAARTPVEVPTPTVRAPEVTAPVPTPEVTAAVPDIESPELAPRPLDQALPVPEPSAQPTSGAVALPDAAPEASQAEATPLVIPEASLSAPDAAVGLATPDATLRQAPTRSLATPLPRATAGTGRVLEATRPSVTSGEARDVGTAAQAGVRARQALPTPSVRATARAVPAEESAPGAAANVPLPDAPAGGDAPQAGQPGDDPLAAADARGLAASPDGRPGDGGTPRQPPAPLQDERPRPLAVILDNTFGYPQTGLPQASWIAEMPVEGGVTRLMAMFDLTEPERVGPIRSARPYFIDVAAGSDAVLVHVGGSPDALTRIDSENIDSLDAFDRGDLFSRAASGRAPYNTFSIGSSLRDAVQRLDVDPRRLLTGFQPSPPGDDLPRADSIAIDWSGAYGSGFRYVEGQDRYRWIRNGEDAVSATGQGILVDAVLIARITATPFPGDSEGRLHIPVDGGEATLYWRGRVQNGTWRIEEGLRFVNEDGVEVSLETLTTWAAFVPQGADVEAD